jgi:hypothetical protein
MYVIVRPNSQNVTSAAKGVTIYGIEVFFHLAAQHRRENNTPLFVETTGEIDALGILVVI